MWNIVPNKKMFVIEEQTTVLFTDTNFKLYENCFNKIV